MSIASAAEKYKLKDNNICPFQRLITILNDEDKKSLDELVKANYPRYLLEKILRDEGYKISKDSIASHLDKMCKCHKA